MNKIDPRGIGAPIRMPMPRLTTLGARVVEAINGRSGLCGASTLRDIAEANLARTRRAVETKHSR